MTLFGRFVNLFRRAPETCPHCRGLMLDRTHHEIDDYWATTKCEDCGATA